MRFDGQRALITGAGKGIGLATARMLKAKGATVIALSRSQEELAKLKAEIDCETVVVDLADISATRQAAVASLPIDLLVNCAGFSLLGNFLELAIETFDKTMRINAVAPIAISQEVARDMIKRGCKGAIVNVSSMASLVGIADQTAYCASKAALDAITRVMAIELGPHGIRVNSVNPTVTLTAMAAMAWSDPEKRARRLSRIPLGRFAEPNEIASVILYLLSDLSSMVHGVCLPVDGGFRAN